MTTATLGSWLPCIRPIDLRCLFLVFSNSPQGSWFSTNILIDKAPLLCLTYIWSSVWVNNWSFNQRFKPSSTKVGQENESILEWISTGILNWFGELVFYYNVLDINFYSFGHLITGTPCNYEGRLLLKEEKTPAPGWSVSRYFKWSATATAHWWEKQIELDKY